VFEEIMWTERAEAHIARHGVTPDEVEDVLGSRGSRRRAGPDDVRYVFGRSAAGRPLVVVVVDSMDGRVYVATARDMTATEVRWFRKMKGC
jgi:uncharacterized DUF497 family protein